MMRFSKAIVFILTGAAMITMMLVRLPDKRNRYEKYLEKEYALAVSGYSSEQGEPRFDNPQMADFQNYLRIRDPQEKTVPHERLFSAYERVKSGKVFKSTELEWQEVPSNMGGRVRTVMFDPNDSLHWRKVWAGAVTGGLWLNNDVYNTDSSWQPVSDFWENLSVSSLVADPKNPEVFYAGTGEAQTAVFMYRESSGKGVGIFKSSDAGTSWELLPSTSAFQYVTDLIIREEEGKSVIYAGVVSGNYKGKAHLSQPSDGLYRSEDGGSSWKQVLPNIAGASMPYSPADIELGPNGRIYVGTYRNVQELGGGTILWSDNGKDWTVFEEYKDRIENSGIPTESIPGRVVLASTEADSNAVYAVVSAGGISEDGFIYYYGKHLIKSSNRGLSWTEMENTGLDSRWSYLAWHALNITVSPTNENQIFIGGLNLNRSTNGGSSWETLSDWRAFGPGTNQEESTYIHADHHQMIFKPGSSDTALFTTDGGVFRTYSASQATPLFTQINNGFNSLQFYTAAIHPEIGSTYYVAGAQDNGTMVYYNNPLNIHSDMLSGGDGAFCFFDEDSPEILISSYYENSYFVNRQSNGRYGLYDAITGTYGTGNFISAADYNSTTNTLIGNAATYNGGYADNLLRIKNVIDEATRAVELMPLYTGTTAAFSAVRFIPAAVSDVLVGTESGRLFKIEDAENDFTVSEIGSPDFPMANISCIVAGKTAKEILVTFSNYGVESIWYTIDGGQNWLKKEGNLPDIPVRWALLNPSSPEEVYLATELGIWLCEDISESIPTWIKLSNFPNVRVDMLRVRSADNTMLVASHGRGMFTTVLPGLSVKQPDNSDPSKEISLFPNPFSSYLVIDPGVSVKVNAIKIYNMKGSLVYEEQYPYTADESIELNTSNWTPGSYLLVINTRSGRITEKLVKQ